MNGSHFKTLVLTYESLSGQTPAYLADPIHEKVNTTTLRSLSELMLDTIKYKPKTYEPNAFIVDAQTL